MGDSPGTTARATDDPAAHAHPLDPCVHCGFCLPACPTYLATGDEADSPRGRIVLMRALERGDIEADDAALRQHLDACLGCRGCEPVCPAGVAYGRGLETARETIAARQGIPLAARAVLAVFRTPWLWRPLFTLAGVARDLGLSRLFQGAGRLGFGMAMLDATRAGAVVEQALSGHAAFGRAPGVGLPPRADGRSSDEDPAAGLPPPNARSGNPTPGALVEWTIPEEKNALTTRCAQPPASDADRSSPRAAGGAPSERASGRGSPAARSYPTTRPSARGEGVPPAARVTTDPDIKIPDRAETPRSRVTLFRGCVMDTLFRHIHDATRRTLQANGYDVIEVGGQGCCGALHDHAGDRNTARELAAHNIAAFGETDSPIAVNSAGCGAILKDYGHLVSSDAAHAFAARIHDVSELLAAAGPRPGAPLDLDVAYDAPCHLQHAQGIHEPVLAIFQAVPSLRLHILPGSDQCCGSAGIYSLLHPTMSRAVLDAKIAALAAASPRPDVIATGNPGCLMQIGGGLRAAGLSTGVAHPVEVLDWSYRQAGYYDDAGPNSG